MAASNPPAVVVIVGTAIPNMLISINSTAQLPLKLTPTNYPSWGVQFPTAKLWSHGVYWGNISMSTEYHHRQRHLSAKSSLSSLDTTGQFLTTCNFCITFWCCYTSHLCCCHNISLDMDKLENLFADGSKTRIMGLKDKLTLATKGDKTISEYMHVIKCIVD